jgi:hypothetical protein
MSGLSYRFGHRGPVSADCIKDPSDLRFRRFDRARSFGRSRPRGRKGMKGGGGSSRRSASRVKFEGHSACVGAVLQTSTLQEHSHPGGDFVHCRDRRGKTDICSPFRRNHVTNALPCPKSRVFRRNMTVVVKQTESLDYLHYRVPIDAACSKFVEQAVVVGPHPVRQTLFRATRFAEKFGDLLSSLHLCLSRGSDRSTFYAKKEAEGNRLVAGLNTGEIRWVTRSKVSTDQGTLGARYAYN